jgi:hypothetical protein
MADQTRFEPLEETNLFPDGTSARPLPAGTIPRGSLANEELVQAKTYPFPITKDVLERGRERYDIFCSPCHDYAGDGKGMVVLRGFRRGPPSFHLDRLREAPADHFFDVISNGFGAMNDYAMQITPRDRWAIVAYIRALQVSQNATPDQLNETDNRELERLPR